MLPFACAVYAAAVHASALEEPAMGICMVRLLVPAGQRWCSRCSCGCRAWSCGMARAGDGAVGCGLLHLLMLIWTDMLFE